MTIRFMAMVVFATLIFGCATTITPMSEARPTPDDRIYYRIHDDKPFATVIFVRDTGFVGSGVYQNVSVDEERGAAIDVGEKATFRIPPGEHVFSVIPTDPFGTHAPYAIDQRLEAGKTYYYRILTDGNTMSTRLQRMLGKPAE